MWVAGGGQGCGQGRGQGPRLLVEAGQGLEVVLQQCEGQGAAGQGGDRGPGHQPPGRQRAARQRGRGWGREARPLGGEVQGLGLVGRGEVAGGRPGRGPGGPLLRAGLLHHAAPPMAPASER